MRAALAVRDGADVAPRGLEAEGRGYFVRVRVRDPRTGRRVQCARAHRGVTVTIWDAVRVRDQLRHGGRERVEGTIRSLPPWRSRRIL
jgi:hypothetical protein